MATELFIAAVRRVDEQGHPERQSSAMTWDQVMAWQWTYYNRVDQDWRNAGIRMAPSPEPRGLMFNRPYRPTDDG